jgi:hypothetical protein
VDAEAGCAPGLIAAAFGQQAEGEFAALAFVERSGVVGGGRGVLRG